VQGRVEGLVGQAQQQASGEVGVARQPRQPRDCPAAPEHRLNEERCLAGKTGQSNSATANSIGSRASSSPASAECLVFAPKYARSDRLRAGLDS
jgi:hypothetical protein